MRLDARKGDFPYFVWHAEECRELIHCVWVDDALCEWFEYCAPYQLNAAGDGVIGSVYKAKKIDIYLGRRVVIVNPIADEEQEYIKACLEAIA